LQERKRQRKIYRGKETQGKIQRGEKKSTDKGGETEG
jgi:hypothetical protein